MSSPTTDRPQQVETDPVLREAAFLLQSWANTFLLLAPAWLRVPTVEFLIKIGWYGKRKS